MTFPKNLRVNLDKPGLWCGPRVAGKVVACFTAFVVAAFTLPLPVAMGQSESAAEPVIELTLAYYGSHRQGAGGINCIDQLKVFWANDPNGVIVVTPDGLGLPGARRKDALRLRYTLDGRKVFTRTGKTGEVYMKHGTSFPLRDAILNHARAIGEMPPLDQPADSSDKTAESAASSDVAESTGAGQPEVTPEAPPETIDTGAVPVIDGSIVDGSNGIARPEYADKEKEIVANLATIQALMVQENGDGQVLGVAVDVIAQREDQRHHVSAFFVGRQEISEEMRVSLDEAIRAVQLRYPKWGDGGIQISFGDKYSPMGGGSAGAAYAVLMLSMLEGFSIDHDFAATGDILVNWKVVAVGAVVPKILGAIADQKKVVAIPAENVDAINDLVIQSAVENAWKVQLFTVPDLQSMIELARVDRPEKITAAIEQFTALQATLAETGESGLAQSEVQAALQAVLDLAPNHESARILLEIAQGRNSGALSRNATLYELSRLMAPLEDMVWSVTDPDYEKITRDRMKTMVQGSARLLKICNEDIKPVVQKADRYFKAIDKLVANPGARTAENVRKAKVEMEEEFRKMSINRELMEKLIRG